MDGIEAKEVLTEIRAFVKANGYAPTVRDLAARFECGHSTVQRALLELMSAGEINRTPGVARGISVKGGGR